MARYLAQRLLLMAITLLLMSVFVFAMVRLVPGDVVSAAAGPGTVELSAEQRDEIREDLGLNRPLLVQYGHWMGDLLRLDLGESYVSRQPVADQLRQAFPVTFELALLALTLSTTAAIILGITGAVMRGTPVDHLTRIVSVLGLTIPNFVLGMVALLVGVRWFGWVPQTRYTEITADPFANLEQMWLPAIILGYVFAGAVARMVRSSILEVLHADFVRTARAKGLLERTVILRHVLRNAMIPVITVMGLQVAGLLGGTVIVESIFNLPGLGRLLLGAVGNRDYPVIQASVLFITALVLVVNLLVDLSYPLIDPRISRGA